MVTGTSTKQSIPGVTSGTGTVRIRAYKKLADGRQKWGDLSTKEFQITSSNNTRLDAVPTLSASVSGTQLKITWGKVKDAEGYEVLYNVGGKGDNRFTTTSTSAVKNISKYPK